MSRTYNHRPHWVKLNDPKFPVIERHQHYVVKREKIGMGIRTRNKWVGGDKYIEEVEYEYPLYRRWSEAVPCTIDIPEISWAREKNRDKNSPLEKLCDKRELISSCPCCSRAGAKRSTNRAQRARIHRQLHNALRDFGHNCDTDPAASSDWPDGFDDDGTIWKSIPIQNWWDVDISEAHKVYHDDKWD